MKVVNKIKFITVTLAMSILAACAANNIKVPIEDTKKYSKIAHDYFTSDLGPLKDPASARVTIKKVYRSVPQDAKDQNVGLVYVCGYVNAKNSFGGYAGKTAFYITVDKEEKIYANLGRDYLGKKDLMKANDIYIQCY